MEKVGHYRMLIDVTGFALEMVEENPLGANARIRRNKEKWKQFRGQGTELEEMIQPGIRQKSSATPSDGINKVFSLIKN
jgi:hypothetical protein